MRRDDFEYRTMPDALSALERELGERAEAQIIAERRRGAVRLRGLRAAGAIAVWPRPLGLLLGAAFVSLLAFLPGTLDRGSGTAFGQPLLLQVEPVPIELDGPSGKLTAARPFTVFGKRALLLSGSGDWCLSVPHRAPGELRDEPAVACVKTRDFFRYGVALRVGRTYVAALPGGVRSPVLNHAGGRKTTLHPDRLGVIAVLELRPGDSVTRFGTNGRPRSSSRVLAEG